MAVVRLDHGGISRLLKSREFAAVVKEAADRVAAEAGEDATVSEYTTDRSAASVWVPAEQQARDGVLTRAAASVGLEVEGRL
ncbi:hypothetical protein [Nocardia asiatica]|uniref:hypothetical protein n=1 Tax=Nocardia asiatica TaxID=209252 RepID=UPI00031ABF16|nr:hypothetical protein [Nocardia asiatica]